MISKNVINEEKCEFSMIKTNEKLVNIKSVYILQIVLNNSKLSIYSSVSFKNYTFISYHNYLYLYNQILIFKYY